MRQARMKLVLGKYVAKRVTRQFGGIQFYLDFGGAGMEVRLNTDADINEGDLLSLYTEVLCAQGSGTQRN